MQNIKFDFKDLDDIELNTYELHSVMEFASAYPLRDLRITRNDENLLYIYVGDPGREEFRFTVYINGDFDGASIQSNTSDTLPNVDSDITE